MEILEKFKEYLLHQKKKVTSVTVKNYTADIRHFISWYEMTYATNFAPTDLSHKAIELFTAEKVSAYSSASLQRHISSLRKFSSFLYSEGYVVASPLSQTVLHNSPVDSFHVDQFKDYLIKTKTATTTVKNYLLDVTHFIRWYKETDQTIVTYGVQEVSIDSLESYKLILQQQLFSISSINRKLSSLRKYCNWLVEQNYAKKTSFPYLVSNMVVKVATPTYIPLPIVTTSNETVFAGDELVSDIFSDNKPLGETNSHSSLFRTVSKKIANQFSSKTNPDIFTTTVKTPNPVVTKIKKNTAFFTDASLEELYIKQHREKTS